jgi:anthranilate synthase component 1
MPSPASSAADDALFQQQLAAGFNFIPIARRWPADLETPLSTWLKVGSGSSHGVLLESVEGGEQVGRWSFVVSNPLWTLTVRADQAVQQWRDGRAQPHQGNPFALDYAVLYTAVAQVPEPATSLLLAGGVMALLGWQRRRAAQRLA